MEFGAAELYLDDPLVQVARDAGWTVYHESFDEDDTWCVRRDQNPVGAFALTGSKTAGLCVVYDAEKWVIGEEEPED